MWYTNSDWIKMYTKILRKCTRKTLKTDKNNGLQDLQQKQVSQDIQELIRSSFPTQATVGVVTFNIVLIPNIQGFPCI